MELKLIDVFRMEHDYSWNTETWFLPLELALDGLSSRDAAWQPPGGGNTVWQTVNHLNYYNNRLIHQINGTSPGKELAMNTETFGEPGDPEDTAGWQAAVEEARRIGEELCHVLAEVDDSNLTEEYVGGLARQIMHTVYHTGQIMLIRKQQGSWQRERE
jgi:hypothetical protein